MVSVAPDSTMALLNRPFAWGLVIRASALAPPPDCPNRVTLFGSPPNAPILALIHCNAIMMSVKPTLPESRYSSPYEERSRCPNTLSLWFTDTTTTLWERLRFAPS